MVKTINVERFLLMGNTYGNLPGIRETGATWDSSHRCWVLRIDRHPMNNAKQRKKLEAMLTALEEKGVRFVSYLMSGAVKE